MYNRGFSIIELLIAMAVMAIGIVGAVATQATAKRNSVDAGQRSTAMFMAHDVIERIRLNKDLADSYIGSVYGTAGYSVTEVKDCVLDNPCTPAEVVTYDLAQWHSMLKNGQASLDATDTTPSLLKPTGCINHVAGELTVVVSWLARESSEDAAQSRSDFEKACGSVSDKRRQVTFTTYIY